MNESLLLHHVCVSLLWTTSILFYPLVLFLHPSSSHAVYQLNYNCGFIIHAIFLKIFTNVTKFYYRFHSPQLKRNLISSTRNLIHKLPHVFPHDLRIIGNEEIWGNPKRTWRHRLVVNLLWRCLHKKYAKTDSKIRFFKLFLIS